MSSMEKYKPWSSIDILLAAFIFISICFPHFLFLTLFPLLWSVVKDWKKNRVTINYIPQLVWIFFFVVLVIYFFFAPESVRSGEEIEHKLSFLIFPVIMLSAKNKIRIDKQILVLCISVLIVGLMGLYNSLNCWVNDGLSCFYTVKISPIHHPSYLMVYVMFSLFGAWFGFVKQWKYFQLSWIIPYSILMILYHLYSQSLSGLLFLMVLFAILAAIWFWNKFGKLVFCGSVLLIFGVFYFAIKTVPQIRGQWSSGVEMLSLFSEDPKRFVESRQFPMSGNEERLTVWAASSVIIKEHPFGVGLGASPEFLKNKLIEFGQVDQAKKGLNAHNQYFQFGLELGWIGILIFCIICCYLIFYSFKTKNWMLLVLIGSLMFNCLFESMLQRQSGVVFYIFWICVLSTLNPKKELI